MNNLWRLEKTMTIKEIAEFLKCSEKHIRITIKKLFPEKLQNGITTFLNEIEVTAIKMEISKNPYLDQVVEVKTDLQMSLQLEESARYFKQKYEELRKENEILKIEQSNNISFEDHFIEIIKLKDNQIEKLIKTIETLKDKFVTKKDFEETLKSIDLDIIKIMKQTETKKPIKKVNKNKYTIR